MYTWEFVPNPPFTFDPIAREQQPVADWEQRKQQLPLGTVLTGKVFARTYFGVFFDAGVGFPVLMRVLEFGRPEGGTRFPEDYPPLDSVISGVLCGFNNNLRQVDVTKPSG